ncbi:sec-independent translocase [Nocardioides limicola]|uniref:sec-independent translocase n=1 Tax=Nocardioides limicola TaxID=2803368 RepID=UPI00193C18E3|nr:sec-independent translocase [Nocardioides sp. DJM-14]
MFGVGLTELAVLAFVAVLVVGPEKLPDLAKQAGRMLRQLRRMADQARDEIRDELGPEFADLELRDLDPRRIVKKTIADAMAMEDDAEEARQRRAAAPGLDPGERPPFDLDAT